MDRTERARRPVRDVRERVDQAAQIRQFGRVRRALHADRRADVGAVQSRHYAFPAAYPKPLFSLINHEEDVDIIPQISAKYRMIPLYTSHWVNPENYHPRPRNERDIDIIMVAAWGKVKRHHALWQALRVVPAS